jgi:hypothetical protein
MDKIKEKELLHLERFLSEYDLSAWEKDILIEFNKSKDIEDFFDCVKKECIPKFLVNLADGIKQYKHDLIP